MAAQDSITAFAGADRVASGDQATVLASVRALLASQDTRQILVFDDITGAQIDLDLRTGTGAANGAPSSSKDAQPDEPPARRKPGRPKLGVVGREVTLLPRHWEWLNSQPGGASVALRKLVEQARRDNAEMDRMRRSQGAACGFMSAIAGNETGFEEANRALFAGDRDSFESLTQEWPADIRAYTLDLASEAFPTAKEPIDE